MKKYTLEIIENNEGQAIKCINEGYNALELIGLLAWKQRDIEKQMFGEIQPDIVTRTVIKDEKERGEDAK